MSKAVEIIGLSKNYRKRMAVDNVTVSVESGETFGYLGPNGAGKTTTIRCMLGLLRPTAGSIRLLGRDVANDLDWILERVGYLPGEFGLWPQMTGGECLDYLGKLQPRQWAGRKDLCDRFEFSQADLDKQVRFYSRGMRQKVAIVQGFQHQPELVILDEPTEGLDPVMKERFMDLLKEHSSAGGATFLSSHILSEVQECAERVAVIRAGKLVREAKTEELAGERVRHCTVTLRKAPAAGIELDLEGVSELSITGLTIKFDFSGDMQPLLRKLAKLAVEEFLSEPETLLEAFFDVYLDQDKGRSEVLAAR